MEEKEGRRKKKPQNRRGASSLGAAQAWPLPVSGAESLKRAQPRVSRVGVKVSEMSIPRENHQGEKQPGLEPMLPKDPQQTDTLPVLEVRELGETGPLEPFQPTTERVKTRRETLGFEH